LAEIFEKNEMQFGPTEEMHEGEYACPTGKKKEDGVE